MELYEEIRREYEHGAGTIREVARKLGVHRREEEEDTIRALKHGKTFSQGCPC